jgi:hypothetical protein
MENLAGNDFNAAGFQRTRISNYLIRFQNTRNDTAFNVNYYVIPLRCKLDWTSLQMTGGQSSVPVN